MSNPIRHADAIRAAEWLRRDELILPTHTQAAIELVADAYDKLQGRVARLLAVCDDADSAVEQENYSDRRAVSTRLIRCLLGDDGGDA